MSSNNTLSDHPAVFFAQSLHDCYLCDIDSKYYIESNVWYTPSASYEGKCLVCLAGSVMAQRFFDKIPEDLNYWNEVVPQHFGREVSRKLYAINSFRSGQFHAGYIAELGLPAPKGLTDIEVEDYDPEDRLDFYNSMLHVCYHLQNYDPVPKDEVKEFTDCCLSVLDGLKQEEKETPSFNAKSLYFWRPLLDIAENKNV